MVSCFPTLYGSDIGIGTSPAPIFLNGSSRKLVKGTIGGSVSDVPYVPEKAKKGRSVHLFDKIGVN